MSDELLKKIEWKRAFYRSLNATNPASNSSEVVKALADIKSELQIQTEISATKENEKGLNAVGSPYLPDQAWHNPKVILNGPKETEWKIVKTEEQLLKDVDKLELLKKLNII